MLANANAYIDNNVLALAIGGGVTLVVAVAILAFQGSVGVSTFGLESCIGIGITVALIAYIRPEVRFSGLDALKAQIALDAAEARRLLSGRPVG